MLASSEQVAENIRRHSEALAKVIADRCWVELIAKNDEQRKKVQEIAMKALLDWYLGDWVPGADNG